VPPSASAPASELEPPEPAAVEPPELLLPAVALPESVAAELLHALAPQAKKPSAARAAEKIWGRALRST
jgi:hypothetical protein